MKDKTKNKSSIIFITIVLTLIFIVVGVIPSLATTNKSNKDIETLMKLQESMVTELAFMRGRLDAMEMRLGEVESRLPAKAPDKN
ncbi:hypothetical protein CAL7716_056830 [Calothrix sp. PCC 7716]|nr:hypothetical protein CAL7716_056830 [Calothrix sp. PCC 7716]